jgi:hypothetical protein
VETRTGSDVELGAPFDRPAFRAQVVRRRAESGVGGGVFDGGDQVEEVDAVGRRDDDVFVEGLDAVEADDGVEVDDAASLHICDHPVRQSDRLRVDATMYCDAGQGTVECDAGAAPEFAGGVVPDGLVGVVVAVETERDAEGLLVVVVDPVASQFDAMLTAIFFASCPEVIRAPDGSS